MESNKSETFEVKIGKLINEAVTGKHVLPDIMAEFTTALEAAKREGREEYKDRLYDELQAMTQGGTVLLREKDIGTAMSLVDYDLELSHPNQPKQEGDGDENN